MYFKLTVFPMQHCIYIHVCKQFAATYIYTHSEYMCAIEKKTTYHTEPNKVMQKGS